eukprot:g46415.t1
MGSSHLLFTVDVQTLYMSIPYQDGVRALCFFLEERPEPFPSAATLQHLAKFVLILNNFFFLTPLTFFSSGHHMGPSYVCLFVGYEEHSLFQSYSGSRPQLFL